MKQTALTLLLVLGLGVSLPAAAGGIGGRVQVTGDAPEQSLEIRRDQKFCGDSMPDDSLRVGEDGGLANAVVYLKNPPDASDQLARPVHDPNVQLDQNGCRYVPRVLAVEAGARLTIVNSDPILHNVHAREGKETRFNLAFPIRNQKLPVTLKEPGLLRVQCDAGHTWMRAWIHVFDHPYFAVTAVDGTYQIPGVPPGTYQVVVWHETLGEQTAEVTVDEKGTADFTFDASVAGDAEKSDESKEGSESDPGGTK